MAALEEAWADNLSTRWNRLASGSDCAPPVRRVDIPKGAGNGTRAWGIPTVAERVAQAVVKASREPELARQCPPDSSGSRPGTSALAAGGVARARCGRSAWVLDLASRHYVDRLDPACLMRAVRPHTDGKGVVRYMDRWLNAPAHLADGTLEPREPGTPHGSVVSPRWATLFWHDAFDLWRQRP